MDRKEIGKIARAKLWAARKQIQDRSMQVESYVVRIYRRRQAGTPAVVGVVEAVASGWQKPFQSLDELSDILAKPDIRTSRSASRKRDRL